MPIVLVSVGPERTQTIERAWRPMRRRPDPGERVAVVMPTRILVVGGGGREHALAWKLSAEPGVNEVVVAPGSDAIAAEPSVRAGPGRRPARRRRRRRRAGARAVAVELVVIGPEAPLAAGVADAARRRSPSSARRAAAAGSRPRARRSATRSPRPPACRWRARGLIDRAALTRRELAARGRGHRGQGRRPGRGQGRDGLRHTGRRGARARSTSVGAMGRSSSRSASTGARRA